MLHTKMKTQALLILALSSLSCTMAQMTCGELTKMQECLDCNSYYWCLPTTPPATKAEIRECTGATPYCNKKPGEQNDMCTAVKSPELCDGTEDDFPCHRSGYYPDIFNCRGFHICHVTETGSDHKYDTCAAGYYFDTVKRQCIKSTKCFTTNCVSKDGFYVYEPNHQYYYNCHDNQLEIMMRCYNGETFNLAKGCVYKCPRIGKVEHEDKRQYYDCAVKGGDGEAKFCPGTSEFDPKKNACNVQYIQLEGEFNLKDLLEGKIKN